MHRHTIRHWAVFTTFLLVLMLGLLPLHAQTADIPPAEIVNDEGGPVLITGQGSYTAPSATALASQPVIFISNSSPVIDRITDPYFEPPQDSQYLGQFTSDYFNSPFSYRIALPAEPVGEYRDLDNDGEQDTGVLTMDIGVLLNIYNDPYYEVRDTASANSSIIYKERFFTDVKEHRYEVTGGKFIIWSPDDQQGYPSGFGEDGLVFTADDPTVRLPQGYTVVDMNQEPFIFDRSREGQIDLIEYEGEAPNDYSAMNYVDSFDALIAQMRKEYAFTDYKKIDWDALVAEFRPQIEAAADYDAYSKVLTQFTWAIPDGHVGSSAFPSNDFQFTTAGGLGLAIRQLDDGRVIVNYLTTDGPAEKAGIELKAQIVAINDLPIEDALDQVTVWSRPFSTDHVLRLQQLRYVTRYPLGAKVNLTYRNPGSSEDQTVTLETIEERDSFSFSSFNRGLTDFELPLEYRLLDNGYAYVKIYTFDESPMLTISLWERLMRTLNNTGTNGLIIDMRQNGGGWNVLYVPMASYFFNEPLVLGSTASYVEDLDSFYLDPNSEERLILPPESLRYSGKVAVLIGPNCASACEFFSYALSLQDRAAIVGQYPTAGLGGSIEPVFLPDDTYFQFTSGRAVDAEGNIYLEGIGVIPTIKVPVNEDTLFAEDPIMDAAVAYLDGATGVNVTDSGAIAIGDTVTGTLVARERQQYTLELKADDAIHIYLTADNNAFDTYLRLIDVSSGITFAESDDIADDNLNSALTDMTMGENRTIIIEVGSANDDGAGAYTLEVQAAASTPAEATPEATPG